MIRTTRKQREALKRVYDRGPIDASGKSCREQASLGLKQAVTYREFRKSAQPVIGGSGCIIVPWCGMWLGIEPDGYTHS